MTNLKDIKIEPCSSSMDLVAYLYDELKAAERESFETHLADCGTCTDEFAELSFARLDVYEWHRDEFAAMETPHFAIPYAEAKVSWLDGVRAFFTLHGRLAVGGAFALVAVVFGAVFISSMNRNDDVASVPKTENIASNKIKPINPSVVPTPANEMLKATNDPPKSESDPSVIKVSTAGKSPAPTKAVIRRPLKTPQRNVNQPVKNAPRLNDFEDEDDNTLRLGYLLADIDTKD
jgi:hypothetical protein